jgi:hypothetical protein
LRERRLRNRVQRFACRVRNQMNMELTHGTTLSSHTAIRFSRTSSAFLNSVPVNLQRLPKTIDSLKGPSLTLRFGQPLEFKAFAA